LQNITNQLESKFSSILKLHYSHTTKKELIKSSSTVTEEKKQVEAYKPWGTTNTVGATTIGRNCCSRILLKKNFCRSCGAKLILQS
jgi:hypothetical protein